MRVSRQLQGYRYRRIWSLGRSKGRAAGLRQGRDDGYRQGFGAQAAHDLIPDGIGLRDIKVLYVASGIGSPYPALDTAIIQSLRGLVRELATVSPDESVAEHAALHRPDLVLALNGVVLPADQVSTMRQSGIRTAVWFTDDPYYTDWTIHIAPRYDYVFTLENSCVGLYRQLGCRHVYHLPFAADPESFRIYPVMPEYRRDISVIGTAYWNRVDAIDRLAPVLSQYHTMISGQWWDRLKAYDRLKKYIQRTDWMGPEETALWYSSSKMVINLHRLAVDETINCNSQAVPALSINPRTFEINACGTLQLCDARNEMASFYTPGKEIVTYESVDELAEKIRYFMTHEDERREIALRGYRRTLREHTYRRRLNQLLEIVAGS
jgi:spore maturation protein CgeB